MHLHFCKINENLLGKGIVIDYERYTHSMHLLTKIIQAFHMRLSFILTFNHITF